MSNRDQIIERLVSNLAEIITEDEFRDRLASGQQLTHYIGFEISGYVHLGTGLMSALVMKDLTDLGVKCTVWLADWHTWINEKLDGTLETAQRIGQGYFAEAIKASFMAVGGDPDKLEIHLASDHYQRDWSDYWRTVISVSQYTTTSRMLRSIDIMGREQGTDVELAKLLYPAMQVADIFYQQLDIAHAGTDQRKAHVIMRDTASKIGKKKAIAIHHPLIDSLRGKKGLIFPATSMTKPGRLAGGDAQVFETPMPPQKMSKSDPSAAVFVHDTPRDIEQKLRQAFCPEKVISDNPVLNWTRHLLFWNRSSPFKIERKAEHGGDIEFAAYADLEQAYAAGEVHPMDLKAAVAKELIALLKPVRDHFAKPEIAAKKAELDKVLANR